MALTRPDRYRLAELENEIEEGQAAFVSVGYALVEIRDKRLYRDGYESFEQYVSLRWRFSRSHAYRLIDAAGVLADLSPTGDAGPANERQARELVPLDAEQRREVWEQATAGGEEPTAASLRELTARALGALPPDEQREVIEGNEREVMDRAGPREARCDGRAEQTALALRLLDRTGKALEWLGDEAEAALSLLEAVRAAVRALA